MFSKKLFSFLGFLSKTPLLAVAIALIVTILVADPQPSHARLPYKSAIKDATVLLRNALPINNELIREIQTTLEAQPRQANLKRWSSMGKDVDKVTDAVTNKSNKLLASVAAPDQAIAKANLKSLSDSLIPLKAAIANKNRNLIKPLVENSLTYVGELEAKMVAGFPFTVPAAYNHLPQLKGRATVEIITDKGAFTMILDGYNAPVNAGQFADLVQRGFYDGLTFNRADDNFFLQAGDPPGVADGYVESGKSRTVPMEIRVPSRKEPIYGSTLGDAGLDRTLPVLPFSAFGTLAMAHPAEDVNGGSSQFFIYLFESDLTPAGLNLIDGNYSAFGYLQQGEEVLRKLKLGDQIKSARIISGAENLIQPALSQL